MTKAPSAALKPRLRLVAGRTIVLGPGKADLLEAVRDSGSLRQAATALGMSYMRAWTLVKTMNAAFRDPVVVLSRGGARHGGATVTPRGLKVLALYRAMEKRALEAASPQMAALRRLLRK